MTLQVQTAASGVARSAHYVIPTGQTQPIQTLLLEPQRTNLCIRSEEFNTWTDSGTCNVTANATTAPDGTTTADLLTATATNSQRFRSVTFTGDGEKCIALYLKAGTSTRSRILLRDGTAAINRHGVNVTWTAGVPSLATESGAGTLYPVEALRDGWYRILFSATAVIAANTNQYIVLPDNLVGTGSVYAWGAQAENAVVPSSYIKTEDATVSRNADSLYFPFTATPQAQTIYLRGIVLEPVNSVGSRRLLWIGSSSVSLDPRMGIQTTATGNQVQAFYDDGITPQFQGPSLATAVQLRDSLEATATLRSDWGVYAQVSINKGNVLTGTAGISGPSVAWATQRIYLTGGVDSGLFAFTHVVVATGEQSLATMRQLAGVV